MPIGAPSRRLGEIVHAALGVHHLAHPMDRPHDFPVLLRRDLSARVGDRITVRLEHDEPSAHLVLVLKHRPEGLLPVPVVEEDPFVPRVRDAFPLHSLMIRVSSMRGPGFEPGNPFGKGS